MNRRSKGFSIRGNQQKNAPNISKIHKMKYIKMMDKVHVYMCFHIALIESTAGNKSRLCSSPFLISSSRFLISAQAFRNNHIAACSTGLRSATEKNEIEGYVTVPCSSIMTQRCSRAH